MSKFKEVTHTNVRHLINQENFLPITIVTPFYNEKNRILNMIYSCLNSDYKNINFILVNDGSTDNTMDILCQEFDLYEIPLIIKQRFKTSLVKHCYRSRKFSNITVMDKEHGPYGNGADCNNVGLNACQTPIMLTIDADAILEANALTELVYNFISQTSCIAVSGSVYVLNGSIIEKGKIIETKLPRSFVGAAQSIEYIRSFSYGRMGYNVFGGAICFPGAFTLFETEALYEVGGFDTVNFAYDAEIISKLHSYMGAHNFPYTITHTGSAFCWTEVPGTLKSFWNQRIKWQRGMWRGVFLHKHLFFNPKFGMVGIIGFPCYVFFEVLGPVVETFSYVLSILNYFFGDTDLNVLIWPFILLSISFQVVITTATLFLNMISFNKLYRLKDNARLIWVSLAEIFWFRQFRALSCTVGTILYVFNRIRGKPL
ncbi:MAG: glycosyltransferase [Legionella sp.]|nr:glycosyltransferase [Legionella sp.]